MMARSARALVRVLLAATTLAPRPASAHPIHTTLTRVASAGDSVTITVRAFADDFSAAVARFAAKPTPRDSSVTTGDVVAYIAARVALADARGKVVGLRVSAIRREAGLYWITLRAAWRDAGRGMTMRNALLDELHADQVNVVQVDEGDVRRVVLFTPGSGARAIGN